MSGPAIICASANPALDRRLRVTLLTPGEINRASSAQGLAGGKAAHVAMAASALMGKSAWIGFLGGPAGLDCAQQMKSLGIEIEPIATVAATRVNLEVIDDSGKITEILEPGGEPSTKEQREFLQVCARRLRDEKDNALLVISGSLPPGVEPNFYVSLIESARAAGAAVFVDTSGEALRASVRAEPDFAKANRAEAEGLIARPVKNLDDAAKAAQQIIALGPKSVAITLGRDGLVWLESKDGPAWIARPPQVQVISTVGCGDATLGGFACAAARGITGDEAIRLATACGTANCLAVAPGRIELATVQELMPRVEVQRLDL